MSRKSERFAEIDGEIYSVEFLSSSWKVIRYDDGVGTTVFNAGKGDAGKAAAIAHLKKMERSKNPVKKKRSAKQLANDKRLGRMAKKRHAMKKSRVTKKSKKKTKSRVTRKKVTRRKVNPKRTTKYVVATLIKGRTNFYDGRKFQTTIAGAAHMTLKGAKSVANASNRKVVIAPNNISIRKIVDALTGK